MQKLFGSSEKMLPLHLEHLCPTLQLAAQKDYFTYGTAFEEFT